MIDFMILGGPRSATTWMANLLTTDHTLCIHDPLLLYTAHQLDQMVIPGKRIGISCTSSLLFPHWVNQHKAKKIILWREVEEINQSLLALGMIPLVKDDHLARLDAVPNVMVYNWKTVFRQQTAKEICERLGVLWCPYRHSELIAMNVQPQMNRLPLGKEAVEELTQRIMEIRK